MLRLAALFCLLTASLFAQTNEEWTRAFPPFRMIGNIYWVGTYDLSTYLITTPAGNILINTGLAGTVPQIQANVVHEQARLSEAPSNSGFRSDARLDLSRF